MTQPIPDLSAPTLKQPPKVTRDIALILMGGFLYVCAIFFRDWIEHRLLGLPQATALYVKQEGAVPIFVSILIRLPGLGLILLAWFRSSSKELRDSLRAGSFKTLAGAAVVTLFVAVLLNNSGLWPFTWRWRGDSTLAYASALIQGDEWGAMVLWVSLGVLLNPFIEEVVFRFGLLQYVRRVTGSPAMAIISTSVLFGVLHLGYLPPDRSHIVNSFWIFTFSTVLAWLTLRRNGNITLSLATHITFNFVTWFFLFLAAQSSLAA